MNIFSCYYVFFYAVSFNVYILFRCITCCFSCLRYFGRVGILFHFSIINNTTMNIMIAKSLCSSSIISMR